MSKNLDKVIQRAISDAAFRRQLQTNPQAALRGFKLTDDEVAALRSGDAGKLGSLGIDQRMSKAFAAFGAMGQASRATGDAVLSVGGTRIPDVGGANIGSADVAGGTNVRSADFDPGTASSAVGDPIMTSQASASDAIEDQSHAFSAGRSADVNAMGVATDEGQLTANTQPTDATGLSDNVAASAAGRQGSLGTGGEGTFASRIHDSEPVDLRGSTYSGDDTAGPGYLASDQATGGISRIRDLDTPDTGRVASGDATGGVSRIRDLDTPDTSGVASGATGGVSRIRDLDTPDTSAVASGDATGAASRIRDLDTPDTSGVASTDAGHVSRIRDLDTPDTSAVASGDTSASSAMIDPDSAEAYAPAFHTGGVQGAPNADALEDMSHSIAASQDASLGAPSSDALEDMSHSIAANQDAFLSGEEATEYVTDPNLSSDQAEDIAHSFNPDGTTTALPDHGAGDAIGNTGTNDPQLSA